MFEKVLFIVLVVLSAYMLKRLRLFSEEDSKVLVNYVLYFSLPALVIQKVREVNLGSDALSVVVLAWGVIGVSLLVSYLAGKLLGLEEKSLKAFVLVSSFGNTAFMGYPFTFALFGDEGLGYAVLYDQLGSFLLVISVGFLIATGRFSVKEVVGFPPFLALLFAFATRDMPVPAFVQTFLEVAGSSLIPVVLFAVGLRFSPEGVFSSIKGAFASLLIKMLLVPLGLLFFLKAWGLATLPYKVVLLESAMPPMVMAGVLALKYELDHALAISSITLGMLLSFFSVPLMVSLL